MLKVTPAQPLRWRLATLAFGLLLLLFGVSSGVHGVEWTNNALRTPNPANRCSAGQTGRCFEGSRATVVATDRTDPRWVGLVDRNDETTSLSLRDDWRPEAGMHVVVERWDGLTVAVYNPRTHERHRTTGWPDWTRGLKGGLLVLLAILLIWSGVWWVVRAVFRRTLVTLP
jgi:hypothetical protein